MDGNNLSTGSMTLTDNETGKSVELPVLHGTIGPRVIDIRKLYAQTGCFTYDPGFMATASSSDMDSSAARRIELMISPFNERLPKPCLLIDYRS